MYISRLLMVTFEDINLNNVFVMVMHAQTFSV